MNQADLVYLDLLKDIVDNGVLKPNRTGTSAYTVFGKMLRFDLSKGFPLLTTKRVHFKSVLHELLWFLRGESNIGYLKEHGVKIWDEWADENGNLGPVYGVQWREWKSLESVSPNMFAYERPKPGKVMEVAYLGDHDSGDPNYDILYNTWTDMLARCYQRPRGRSPFVDKEWLTFSNFQKDAPKLENWLLKKEFPDSYLLDTSFYCSNKYSPETCKWATKKERQYNKEPFGPSTKIVDQIHTLIAQIRNNPESRRHILTAWNPTEIPEMKLPPCHYCCNFFVLEGKLSCLFNMRSIDCFLGLPFNIASYALLLHIFAHVCNLEVGELVWVGADAHLYENHIEQAKLQMSREPFDLPTIKIDDSIRNIDDFEYHHIELLDYKYHPSIKAPIAV